MLCIGSEPLVLYQITENYAGIMPNVVIRPTCQDRPNIYLRIYTKVDADCTTLTLWQGKSHNSWKKIVLLLKDFPFRLLCIAKSLPLYCELLANLYISCFLSHIIPGT